MDEWIASLDINLSWIMIQAATWEPVVKLINISILVLICLFSKYRHLEHIK